MNRQVIGIDFGSTHCAIATMRIETTTRPELMNLTLGKKTIDSELILDSNGECAAFGDEIQDYLKNHSNDKIKIHSNYKRKIAKCGSGVSDSEIQEAKNCCRLTIKELAKKFKELNNLDTIRSDEYSTCFAYPASWGEEEISLINQYLIEAGFPSEKDGKIYAIPESVAAMHALRVSKENIFKFGEHQEYYLIIDFGGGTLDITVIQTEVLGKNAKVIESYGLPMF